MNIGFDGKWVVFNHTSRGNLCRNLISAMASEFPHNKYFIYSKISAENRHLTPLLVSPNVMLKEPRHGMSISLWRWGNGWSKDMRRHRTRIYHGLCGLLPLSTGKSHTRQVVSVNDLHVLYHPQSFTCWQRFKNRLALRHSLKKADRIVVPSTWALQEVASKMGVDASRIDVVPPCIDSNFSVKVHDEAKHTLSTQMGLPRRFVLLMGPLEEYKCALDMVRAIRRLKDQDMGLVLAGKSSRYYRKVVRPYIERHQLTERVVHVKHLHSVDLPIIYQLATAVLCPARQGLYSLSMLEAMSCGIPVIANPGTVITAEAADAVLATRDDSPESWANAIDQIIASPQLHDTLSERGLLYASQFTPSRSAQALMACYDKISD